MTFKHSDNGKRPSNHARRTPRTSSFVKWNLIVIDILLILALIFFLFNRQQTTVQRENAEPASSQQVVSSADTASSTETTDTSSEDTSGVEWVHQDQPVQLPILMYHAVHVMDPAEAANANLIVAPDVFESHLKALQDAGYYTVSPEEAYKMLTENVVPKDRKAVWITFDDGVQDFYTVAYPLLKQYQFKATNNVITNFVATNAPSTLTLTQMQEMKNDGMSFEDHTATHPNLITLTNTEKQAELSDSKQYLDSNLAQTTTTIAYPSGQYDDATSQLAASLGYQLGLTTENGVASAADGLLTLRRIRVTPDTTSAYLLSQMAVSN